MCLDLEFVSSQNVLKFEKNHVLQVGDFAEIEPFLTFWTKHIIL